MDAAEQVWAGGAAQKTGISLGGGGMISVTSSGCSQFTYGPRHKAAACLLVPFICFKFNNIYCPGISSVNPSSQCILYMPGPVGDAESGQGCRKCSAQGAGVLKGSRSEELWAVKDPRTGTATTAEQQTHSNATSPSPGTWWRRWLGLEMNFMC